MIDFSKYTLTELQAMSDVLDDLTYRMSISEVMQAHLLPFHYYKEVTGAVSAAIDQQALDAASAPPAEDPAGLRDLQALVDTLSRCSDQLVALALAEDKRFAASGQTNAFIKLTVLRNANRSIIDMMADIRDHYDGLH